MFMLDSNLACYFSCISDQYFQEDKTNKIRRLQRQSFSWLLINFIEVCHIFTACCTFVYLSVSTSW